MPCNDKATPLGAGRGRSPVVVPLHVKTYPAAEYALGQEPEVLFGNLPMRTPDGRDGHLLGVEIEYGLTYAVNATSLSAAKAGREFHGVIDNIQLTAGGVPHFAPDTDGRDLVEDYYFRNGVLAVDDPSAIPDSAGGAEARANIRLRYFFGSRTKPKGLMDCAIPLAMLDHRVDSNDKMTFQIRSTLKGVSVAAGVTLLTCSGLTVRALVAYTEDPYLDAHWYLKRDSTSQNTHTIEPRFPDRPCKIEYARLQPRLEDGASSDLTTEYAGVFNIRHGEFPWVVGRNGDQMDGMQRLAEEVDWINSRTAKAGGTYPQPASLAVVPRQPWAQRSDLGSPQIYFEHSTAPVTTTTSRFLHRQVYQSAEAWRAEAKCRLGREGSVGVTPGAVADVNMKLLPQRLVRPDSDTVVALTGQKPA